jgi:hypothetical protein
VRLGEDLNWWVQEISDSVHWDVDGLSIVDPRQVAHILDLLDPLRDYGLQQDIIEAAFFPFAIRETLPDGRVKLLRVHESLLESDDKLFALPDIVDEEKGPYADFIDHITKLRVKFLNDAIELEQRLTVDDLEEEIREDHHNAFMEGRAIHVFQEITDILEYMPKGFELDEEEASEEPAKEPEEQIATEFPDLEEENIEEDETMKWEDDEEKDKEGEGEKEEGPTEDLDALSDDEDEEEEAEEDEDEDDDGSGERREKSSRRPAPKASPPKKSGGKKK